MLIFRLLFFIFVLITPTVPVRVNLHGSLSLGKEVMDTLSFYMRKNRAESRRSNNSPDKIMSLIASVKLCEGIAMCEEKHAFVDEYIQVISKGLESIFEGILHPSDTRRQIVDKHQLILFQDQLRTLLDDIKAVIKNIDSEMTADNIEYSWIGLLKTTSSKFIEMALTFVMERLEGNPIEVIEVQRKLSQKLVLVIIIVETKYIDKLCKEYKYCPRQMTCTRYLSSFLNNIKDMSDEKIRLFIKYFHESIPENALAFLDENTANAFQVILSDMIYLENVPTKDILMKVHQPIKKRIRTFSTDNLNNIPYDVILIKAIMSDLDHFYNEKHKVYSFQNFLANIANWARSNEGLHSQINQVMTELQEKLSAQPDELITKLKNEVKVFLELTMD